jgi:hypothetical protein
MLLQPLRIYQRLLQQRTLRPVMHVAPSYQLPFTHSAPSLKQSWQVPPQKGAVPMVQHLPCHWFALLAAVAVVAAVAAVAAVVAAVARRARGAPARPSAGQKDKS